MSASENGHTGGYTPGPWWSEGEYDEDERGCAIIAANTDCGPLPGNPTRGMVAWASELLPERADECIANARLIAAAPEMHEAGRKLANEVAGLKAFEHELRAVIGNTNWSVLMQRLAEADAAIPKAQGGAA